MLELFFLLLPVAMYSGWYIGRRAQTETQMDAKGQPLSSNYYVGLNFLLNDETDKAVDAFIKMLEVSPDTVETTLALGNFFRRRGEVDRAILIHQNLIAKPDLTRKQRNQALSELAQDYMRAGMYDRAESLFLEIIQFVDEQLESSLLHLIDIYEREKEWEKAIQVAVRLSAMSAQSKRQDIAHYYCELAQLSWAKGKIGHAFHFLKRGLRYDKCCARISMLQGKFLIKLGKFKKALFHLQQVEHQDQAYLPETLALMIDCYSRLGDQTGLTDYLNYLVHRAPSISIVLAHAKQLQYQEGKEKAAQYLTNYMYLHPSVRGLKQLIEYHLSRIGDAARQELLMLKALVEHLLEKKPIYRCGECGFSSRELHWQCPSCRLWSQVKPILGVEGE